eukprot:CAMPEP_0185310754 /NCGR_PEP_ID=MMETSP1363-20130426/25576_1 /TAXON_ID=38817 /ORGANISM="Gephyrocapsa oceanica, Strain RCC1303" /LENGTH=159 /DNA_ID=CAMNT_0027908339 /DNA_START=201 /DNA_END=678 /DNA_ORIENTATION=+
MMTAQGRAVLSRRVMLCTICWGEFFSTSGAASAHRSGCLPRHAQTDSFSPASVHEPVQRAAARPQSSARVGETEAAAEPPHPAPQGEGLALPLASRNEAALELADCEPGAAASEPAERHCGRNEGEEHKRSHRGMVATSLYDEVRVVGFDASLTERGAE